MRRKDAVVINAGRHHCEVLGIRRTSCRASRGTHLGKLRQVPLLENEAYVRVSNQHPLSVNGVGVSGLADFDSGDHIPNSSQANLRGGDATSPGIFGNSNGEVRFGLVSKINRTEISLSIFRLDECRIPGMVFLAVVHIQVQPRDAHFLPPLRVEMSYIRDSRDVAEQAKIVLLSLLACQNEVVKGVLDRPAYLSLDLFDELLDLGRGGHGLLALDSG